MARSLLLFAFSVFGAIAAADFPTTVSEDLAKQCQFTTKTKELVEGCLRDFAANGCNTYSGDPEVQAKLASCNSHESTELDTQQGDQILKECGEQVLASYKELFDFAVSLPSSIGSLASWLSSSDTALLKAHQICLGQLKELGLEQAPPDRYFSVDFSDKTARWNNCLAVERRRIADVQVDKQKAEQLEYFRTLIKNLRCFKQAYWAPMACPMISDALLFGVVGVSAKAIGRRMLALAAQESNLTQTTVRKAEGILEARKFQAPVRETRNADHLHDLVGFVQSPMISRLCVKHGLDCDALVKGIMDSDWKSAAAWSKKVLEPGPNSDELLEVLTGRSETPAGLAFRKLLGNKTYLPNLPKEKLREVFKKYPLLQLYLHEIPGLGDAIADFNHGVILKEQFLKRVTANLFHNGPHAGFWKKLAEKIASLFDDSLKDFLRDTVWDGGEKTKNGVVVPRTPPSLSAEGVVHKVGDRVSQATGGGIRKIFADEGNSTFEKDPTIPIRNFPKGLGTVEELALGNPRDTLEQLIEEQQNVRQMSQLSEAERRDLTQLIDLGRQRIQREIDYFKAHLQKLPDGSYKLNYADGSTQTLIESTPANEVDNSLGKLIEDEERVNGNPMTDLYGPVLSASFYAKVGVGAAARTVLTQGICRLPSSIAPPPPATRH